jgi:tetratricopeptide (TPR) repeat protein
MRENRGFLSICILITVMSFFIGCNDLQNKKNNSVKHVVSGIEYHNKGKYNEAIAVYKRAIEIDPKHANSYINMGNAYADLKKYNEVVTAYKKAIEIDPGDASIKMNLAEANLLAEHFNHAFVLANDLLKEKDILHGDSLAMRFVSICSLVFQGKQAEAADRLREFIKFYRSIPGEYERTWEYNTAKNFITQYKKLPPEQLKLLLQLVDLLESPKEEGDKKLKELETSIREIFK